MGIRLYLAALLSVMAVPALASSPLFQGHVKNTMPIDNQATDTQSFTPLPPLMDQVTGDATKDAMTWQSFCQTLTQHQPSADVNYQGNVDVRGNPVTPADLQARAPLNLPQAYRVFITTDQMSKLGINIPGVPLKADTFVGQAVVSPNGTVTFNGQPVSTQQVYATCGTLPR
jgi:hypothetical protein